MVKNSKSYLGQGTLMNVSKCLKSIDFYIMKASLVFHCALRIPLIFWFQAEVIKEAIYNVINFTDNFDFSTFQCQYSLYMNILMWKYAVEVKADSEGPDQTARPRSLILAFAVRLKDHWLL